MTDTHSYSHTRACTISITIPAHAPRDNSVCACAKIHSAVIATTFRGESDVSPLLAIQCDIICPNGVADLSLKMPNDL